MLCHKLGTRRCRHTFSSEVSSLGGTSSYPSMVTTCRRRLFFWHVPSCTTPRKAQILDTTPDLRCNY